MDKQTFITTIKPKLKELGFRKNGNYWYKTKLEIVCCIYVEGSQWCTENYYTNIGFCLPSVNKNNPTILHWYCRHRCKGHHGEVNMLPDEFLHECDKLFDSIQSFEQLSAFLTKNAQKVCSQYWF